MNMFKSRRKAKEQSDALEALNGGFTTPTTYKTIKTMKRKNKGIPEDFSSTFDLSTALPDSDEFRTSLLMPNLSARFSMLREQDDPNTKIGKASDDSVLFPKRVSRMNLFTHTPLADVAEVESIYSSFRPPFADRDRAGSFGDGYDSDGGSIMSRSRPVEGASPFGGRQKPFRLPTSSTRNFAENDGILNSRYQYEPDIPLSHFQQYRMREKENQAAEDINRISVPQTDGGDSSEVASPATAFSKKRGTQSSTNSGPRRSSTAATSVASESPVLRDSATDCIASRVSEKAANTSDNNFAPSTAKAREDTIPNRFASTSKKDKPPRPLPVFQSSPYRNVSSPPILASSQPLDFGFKTEVRSPSATDHHQRDSPTHGHLPGSDDVLANSVQPNDRGKATALGLFNKPAREFDEQQFNQRQLQMHHLSSASNNSRTTSRTYEEAPKSRQSDLSIITTENVVQDHRTSTPQVPPIPSTSASPVPLSNRASRASGRSTPPRRRSKSLASATATANVKARLESLIQKQNAELAALESEKLGDLDPTEDKENQGHPFFEDDDDEESESDDVNPFDSSRAASLRVDESDIHPAFRNSYRVSDAHSRKSNHSNFSKTRSMLDDERNDVSRLPVPPKEQSASQDGSLGLSGLIRTHLRHDSDNPSIMLPPESSVAPRTSEPARTGSIASVGITAADSLSCEPFDFDVSRISQAPPTPTTAMSQAAQNFLSQAIAMRNAAEKEKVENSVTEPGTFTEKPWQELEPKHQRGESSETTKERREFDDELAERRRKIREGLKSVTERERSQSPANAGRGQNVSMQAFVQQRAVTDPQPKALKMLGLQSRHGLGSPVEDDRGRNTGSRNGHRAGADYTFQNSQQTVTYARFGPDTSSDRHHPPRSATPPASRRGMRDRSNSTVDHRSRSRNQHREQNPPIPTGRANRAHPDQPSSSPSDEPQADSESSMNSRNGHRGPKSPPTDLVTGTSTRSSPKPSPISIQNPYDSSFDSSKPSPGPFSNGRTTPNNGRATPTLYSRKRSVTKTMISEPTFVSSTSSVPLVHLPAAQHSGTTPTPPVPMMNPRRRGNSGADRPVLSPIGGTFSRSTPLETVPASPMNLDFGADAFGIGRKSPSPKKLRKANSEGGSMAAIARQQAMAADLAHEKVRSPALPVFPNHSASALDTSSDGAMF